jgi:hypothetical protein
MENKTKRKIQKKAKGSNLAKAWLEVANLEDSHRSGAIPFGHTPHRVNVGGAVFDAYDARTISRVFSSSGRGNYRWLGQDGTIVGLAVHRANGQYRRIA